MPIFVASNLRFSKLQRHSSRPIVHIHVAQKDRAFGHRGERLAAAPPAQSDEQRQEVRPPPRLLILTFVELVVDTNSAMDKQLVNQ